MSAPNPPKGLMHYHLSRVGSSMGVGWFSCIPAQALDFDQALSYSRTHPHDQFMHKYLLELTAKYEPDQMDRLRAQARKQEDFHLLALLYETCLLHARYQPLMQAFQGLNLAALAEHSPLIYIPWSQESNREDNFYWLRAFSANANLLTPLPAPEEAAFPIPFGHDLIDGWRRGVVHLKDLVSPTQGGHAPSDSRPAKERAKKLRNAMETLGILTGWETRTEATLSPYAIERPWNLDITVEDGRNQCRLSGILTGYGRGFNVHQGRISCLMETVERYSAFATIRSGRTEGHTKDYALHRARYEDLKKKGPSVLDPQQICLEVAYQDQSLAWIQGERRAPEGVHPVYVPAQLVFLFSNLDEKSLTTGLPSNGLAAGNTMEEAKVSALLEVIERDAEKVVPYSGHRCFVLEAEDPKVSDLLEGHKKKGIHIQFMDMTPEFGIPCFKAFIQGPGGVILKGSGAHLDAKRAVASAMTEIPYPYPYWFGSMPAPWDLPIRYYEDLPNYSSDKAPQDLETLERLLILNGYHPIYVDLTRKDLKIPVVKALIPGLEMMTVVDRFSPLGLRQFGHYLRDVSKA